MQKHGGKIHCWPLPAIRTTENSAVFVKLLLFTYCTIMSLTIIISITLVMCSLFFYGSKFQSWPTAQTIHTLILCIIFRTLQQCTHCQNNPLIKHCTMAEKRGPSVDFLKLAQNATKKTIFSFQQFFGWYFSSCLLVFGFYYVYM